jgi:hypothetical protein
MRLLGAETTTEKGQQSAARGTDGPRPTASNVCLQFIDAISPTPRVGAWTDPIPAVVPERFPNVERLTLEAELDMDLITARKWFPHLRDGDARTTSKIPRHAAGADEVRARNLKCHDLAIVVLNRELPWRLTKRV